jgi:hypothetical protein
MSRYIPATLIPLAKWHDQHIKRENIGEWKPVWTKWQGMTKWNLKGHQNLEYG